MAIGKIVGGNLKLAMGNRQLGNRQLVLGNWKKVLIGMVWYVLAWVGMVLYALVWFGMNFMGWYCLVWFGVGGKVMFGNVLEYSRMFWESPKRFMGGGWYSYSGPDFLNLR